MGLLRFYWLRHATPINPGDILYGDDIPVDVSNAAELAFAASRLPHGAAWETTGIARTITTARALLAHRPPAESGTIQLGTRTGLREQEFGDWVGQTRTTLRNNPAYRAYMHDPISVTPPNGENFSVFAARVCADIEHLVKQYPQGGDNVIVAHGGTIRAALAQATGMALRDTLRVAVEPLSLTVLTYDTEKKARGKNPWTVEGVNLKP